MQSSWWKEVQISGHLKEARMKGKEEEGRDWKLEEGVDQAVLGSVWAKDLEELVLHVPPWGLSSQLGCDTLKWCPTKVWLSPKGNPPSRNQLLRDTKKVCVMYVTQKCGCYLQLGHALETKAPDWGLIISLSSSRCLMTGQIWIGLKDHNEFFPVYRDTKLNESSALGITATIWESDETCGFFYIENCITQVYPSLSAFLSWVNGSHRNTSMGFWLTMSFSYKAMLNFKDFLSVTNPHLHLAPPFFLHCHCLNFGPLLLFPKIIIISSEFVPLLLASYPSNQFFTYSMGKNWVV